MVHITQLIYLKEGQEATFDKFEAIAIPIIYKYNGQLMLRLRPGKHEIVECNIDPPYEVHLITFETEKDFENFMHDPERKKFLHLKEESIRSSVLYKGQAL